MIRKNWDLNEATDEYIKDLFKHLNTDVRKLTDNIKKIEFANGVAKDVSRTIDKKLSKFNEELG